MTVLRINGKQVDVDIEAELRTYPWVQERWTAGKLIACSPFRADTTPSFFVDLESGGWADSGGIGEYTNGNFVTLIGYLRNTSTYEAGKYLIDKYGALYEITDDSKPIKIKKPEIRIDTRTDREIKGEHVIQATSPYMTTRGIIADVQREFAIGYGEGHKGFTAIPWHTVDGRLANVKYRSTNGKRFFFESGATPVSTLVYGLDKARGNDYVIIVEGEIDALSWRTAGYEAVAVGGAYISDEQVEAIAREGFDKIYAAGDSDKQGRKLNGMIVSKLRRYARIFETNYGKEKDANDVLVRQGVQGLTDVYDKASPIRAISLRI